MEKILALRTNFAAPGLYVGPTPTVTLAGGGARVKVTSTAHGLTTGQDIVLSGTTGVTGLNATWFIEVIDANNYWLNGTTALTGTVAGTPAVALPDLDISTVDFSGEWYLNILVRGTGVVAIEDTVNNWSNSERRFIANAKDNAEGQQFNFSWREWKGNERFGQASAKMRIRLVSGTNVLVNARVTV